MKRKISIIMVALLVASTAVLLASCGGVTAEKWNSAMEAYATADAITLKIEDNNKTMNQFTNKERLISTLEVTFDAEKGLVHVSADYTRRNFWEADIGVGAYEIYYVIDGTNVISYKKNLSTQQWETPHTTELSSNEAAKEYLRERYLKPTDPNENEFPIFTDLKFEDFKAGLFGKYEWKHADSRFQYTHTLNFARSKVTEFTYRHKAASGGNVDDSRKFFMAIEYTASITLPNDLPNLQ